MKKIIAIALALMLCVTALSVAAFAAFEGIESMAIVGDSIPGVDNWAPDSATGDMTEVATGIWVKEIVVTEAVTMKIKFAANDMWDGGANLGSGTLTIDGEATDLENGPASGDMTLNVTEPCTLKFTVDLNGEVATAKVETVVEDGGNEGGNEGGEEGGDVNPGMGDLSIAAVSVALLAATAGMVLTISKKEN